MIQIGPDFECCMNCVHYGLGWYKATQIAPGNVCMRVEKPARRAKVLFPNRKFYYRAKPRDYCKHFKKWTQGEVKIIINDKK